MLSSHIAYMQITATIAPRLPLALTGTLTLPLTLPLTLHHTLLLPLTLPLPPLQRVLVCSFEIPREMNYTHGLAYTRSGIRIHFNSLFYANGNINIINFMYFFMFFAIRITK